MLYITSGLADVGIEPDVEAESTIVYQFAVESFDFVSKECLAILGARANLEEEKLVGYVKESLALQSLHGTSNLNKCYVALSAVKHVIENKEIFQIMCKNYLMDFQLPKKVLLINGFFSLIFSFNWYMQLIMKLL